ncbi:MAG: (Fe-S)-binding protein [Gemmatimonadetes bacterium]|nr:(Fe-S)-binding protein [Gemmatimonadota bacterium]
MRVSLFVTCLGDRFFADAAADAVRLLRSLDVEVDFPKNQTCCGQPAWNAGDVPEALRMAAHTAEVFADADYVVLPSGSCTAMLRCTYPRLLDSPAVAERSYELAEFIVDVLEVTELGRGLGNGDRCQAKRQTEVGGDRDLHGFLPTVGFRSAAMHRAARSTSSSNLRMVRISNHGRLVSEHQDG